MPEQQKTFKNNAFKFMKRDGKDVEEGKWIKGRDGRIGSNQEDRCKIWKEHIWREL